ncbi:MAG: fibronectin type III domain-containing protein [Oscillospiraceae bacterium]|nr:fibronectin type III domain-containing protein [Oscillospiraceae bacterium]
MAEVIDMSQFENTPAPETTKSASDQPALSNLRVYPDSATSAHLYWDCPSLSGDTFSVTHGKDDEPFVLDDGFSLGAHYRVTDLEPGEAYTFRVTSSGSALSIEKKITMPKMSLRFAIHTQGSPTLKLPFDGWLDDDYNNKPAKGVVILAGWAVYGDLNNVLITVDGQPIGYADRHIRDDALEATRKDARDYSSSTPLPGFAIVWDTTQFTNGRHLIQMKIVGDDGNVSSDNNFYIRQTRDKWITVENP